jgi:hypothetical protein
MIALHRKAVSIIATLVIALACVISASANTGATTSGAGFNSMSASGAVMLRHHRHWRHHHHRHH